MTELRAMRRWSRTFGVAVLVPAIVLAYLVAMNALDTATPRAPGALQVIWWGCVISAVIAALAVGAVGGVVRAVVVSALIWGALAVGVYLLLGPTCPLGAIAGAAGPAEPAKVGWPAIRLQESFDALCSVSGTVARSVDARWVLKTGALAMSLSVAGALATLTRRRIAARAKSASAARHRFSRTNS